jgi:hypothetical protein
METTATMLIAGLSAVFAVSLLFLSVFVTSDVRGFKRERGAKRAAPKPDGVIKDPLPHVGSSPSPLS